MLTIGRFAPSPTGPLHFGSLIAALASYLAVRHVGGKWFLRIEDIDKPRSQAGAAESIIQTLGAYGFEWDGNILYQSQRQAFYQDALADLTNHSYPCTCARKYLRRHAEMGSYGIIYPGTCRGQVLANPEQQHAIRLRTHNQAICFTDEVRGQYCQQLETDLGDFIIRRSDGLFAYQLAVVVDDALQNINQVVRGADLLDNTPRQIWLQQLLGLPQPSYAHVPLALNPQGQKLSKQTHAPAIGLQDQLQKLIAALGFLGQEPPSATQFANLNQFWDWAIQHWDTQKIPKVHALPLTADEDNHA